MYFTEESLVNVPPKQFDPFLLRCLRARKFDIHRAAKTVHIYFPWSKSFTCLADKSLKIWNSSVQKILLYELQLERDYGLPPPIDV